MRIFRGHEDRLFEDAAVKCFRCVTLCYFGRFSGLNGVDRWQDKKNGGKDPIQQGKGRERPAKIE